MTKVIKKDLYLIKINKVMLFFIIIPLLMGITSTGLLLSAVDNSAVNSEMNRVISFIISMSAVVLFMYIGIICTIGYDEQNKSDTILNSMPVHRSNIIISKYICLVIYFIVSMTIIICIPLAAKFTVNENLPIFSVREVILIFLAGITMSSILIPLYYKFGYVNLKYVSMIVFLLIFSIPTILKKLMLSGRIDIQSLTSKIGNNSFALNMFMLCIGLIIMFISMFITIFIYKRKEF